MNNFKVEFAYSDVNYGQIDPGMIAPEDYLSPDNFIRRDAIKDRPFWSKMLKVAASKMN